MGAGCFNVAASLEYKSLKDGDLGRLKDVAKCSKDHFEGSVQERKKLGARIFKKIQKQVCITL